jgi:uncharacterized membrane protein YcaP (DUF421 family)
MFYPEKPVLEIFIRGSAVYLGLFTILRVILKRESATLGMTDLLVVVLLADAAQNALSSDYRSITDGFILVITIVGWSYILNFLGHRFPFFQRLIKPPKLLLVKDGRMLKKNMRKEFITEDELMSEIRISGVSTLEEVKEAYMEPTGKVSVISNNSVSTSKSDQKKLL